MSSVSASVDEASVRLVFSGALNAASATELSRYRVEVHGIEAVIESAANVNSSTVVLGLSEGALRDGDTLTITYDLLDLQSRTVGGETPVTAR